MAVLRTKVRVLSNAWTTYVDAPAPGKVRRVDVSLTNVTAGGTFAAASSQLLDSVEPANNNVMRNAYPLPPAPDPDSTVILHYSLMLVDGQALQLKSGAPNSVSATIEVQETDAPNA